MQINKIIFVTLAMFFALFAVQDSLAQRKNRSTKSKVITKSRQIQTVSVTKNESTGATEIGTNLLFGMSTPRQNLYVGPTYSSDETETINLHVFSYSNDYQYADHVYTDILVGGESLLPKNYQPSRIAGTENGMAVEILTIPLDFSEFENLISASRVDVVINWYTKFTISSQNISIMRSFYQKVLPVIETSRIEKQKLIAEQQAKRNSVIEAEKKRLREQQDIADEKLKAQEQEQELKRCKLSLNESPEVRGLKLGMSKKEVMPRFRTDYKPYNDSWLKVCDERATETFRPIENYIYRGPQSFENIESYNLRFMRDRLFQIEIVYSTLWKDKKDFLSDLSKYITLPQYWNESNEIYDDFYSNTCVGWTIRVGKNRLQLYEDYTQVLADCKSQGNVNNSPENEQKRKVFKP